MTTHEVEEMLDITKKTLIYLNTHKTQVCHKYIFNGTLLNRQ